MGSALVKPEIRIVGFDDAPFRRGDAKTEVIGAVFRGGSFLDGVIAATIEVDGLDAGDRIAEAVLGSRHKEQLQMIMLDGVTFGGFNVADIGRLHQETGIPVIAVVRDRPDMEAIRKALSSLPEAEARWKAMKGAGPVRPLEVKNPKTGSQRSIWFQMSGIGEDEAREVIRSSSTRSFMPEPLRVAHLMGEGLKEIKWKETRKR